MGSRRRREHLPGEDPHTGSQGVFRAASAGREREVGDRTDGVQGLAAEAQGDYAREVVCGPDLARGMLRNGPLCVLGRHTRAVVADPDQGHPSVLYLDLDPARASIERVLDQLLHGGRTTLDALPRGYPFRHPGRQHTDHTPLPDRLFRNERGKELHMIPNVAGSTSKPSSLATWRNRLSRHTKPAPFVSPSPHLSAA